MSAPVESYSFLVRLPLSRMRERHPLARKRRFVVANRNRRVRNGCVKRCLLGIVPVASCDAIAFVEIDFEAQFCELSVGNQATSSALVESAESRDEPRSPHTRPNNSNLLHWPPKLVRGGLRPKAAG